MEKAKSFKELGKLLGIEEHIYTLFAVELLNSQGKKGLKIIRVETQNGEAIPIKKFLEEHRLDPVQLGYDFIGSKGIPINNKIKVVKVKIRKQQEQQDQK
mgnify:CR=1 FL=1